MGALSLITIFYLMCRWRVAIFKDKYNHSNVDRLVSLCAKLFNPDYTSGFRADISLQTAEDGMLH